MFNRSKNALLSLEIVVFKSSRRAKKKSLQLLRDPNDKGAGLSTQDKRGWRFPRLPDLRFPRLLDLRFPRLPDRFPCLRTCTRISLDMQCSLIFCGLLSSANLTTDPIITQLIDSLNWHCATVPRDLLKKLTQLESLLL